MMKKKYFPHLCYSREKITANQCLDEENNHTEGLQNTGDAANIGDCQNDDARSQLSYSTDGNKSTTAYSTVAGDSQGQSTESMKCNMILGRESRSDTLHKFIESLKNDRNISEQEWLKTRLITMRSQPIVLRLFFMSLLLLLLMMLLL